MRFDLVVFAYRKREYFGPYTNNMVYDGYDCENLTIKYWFDLIEEGPQDENYEAKSYVIPGEFLQ